MYQFGGGKDEAITAATFLPSWWDDDEEDPEAASKEALDAKVTRMFAALGGLDTRGS